MISLDPETLDEVLADLVTTRGGRRRAGAGRARSEPSLDRRLAAVADAVAGTPRPRVAALEWLDPVYVGGHWVPEMIALAEARTSLGEPGTQTRGWSTGARSPRPRPEVRGRDAVRPLRRRGRRAGTRHLDRLLAGRRRASSPSMPPRRSRGPAPDWSTASSCSPTCFTPDRLAHPAGIGLRDDRRRAAASRTRAAAPRARSRRRRSPRRRRQRAERRSSRRPRSPSGWRLGSGRTVISSAASPPPMSPPRWPPTLIPETLKVKTRLMTTKNPTWEASSSMPRSRAIRKAADHQPEDPPEAPTVTSFGSSEQRAERAAEDRDEVDAEEARACRSPARAGCR